jgi:hypothetical protein
MLEALEKGVRGGKRSSLLDQVYSPALTERGLFSLLDAQRLRLQSRCGNH